MVEELSHPDRVVLLVSRLLQSMVLAHILEHHDVLAELAEGVEERDALVEIDRAVTLVMQQQQRCLDLCRVECRRVPDVGVVKIGRASCRERGGRSGAGGWRSA